jgi:hypothetical protein
MAGGVDSGRHPNPAMGYAPPPGAYGDDRGAGGGWAASASAGEASVGDPPGDGWVRRGSGQEGCHG